MTIYNNVNGTNFLAKFDNEDRDGKELKALLDCQSVPSFRYVEPSSPILNVVYCRFPLTNFGSILDKKDNTALVSNDYSVILVKQKDVIYFFMDNDIKPNCVFFPKGGKNQQLWRNNYIISLVIKLTRDTSLFERSGAFIEINNTTTFDDVIELLKKSTLSNVKRINTLSISTDKEDPYCELRTEEEGRLGFYLSFSISRPQYIQHEKVTIAKFFYISNIMKGYGIPFDDLKSLLFCGKNGLLWRFDDVLYLSSTVKSGKSKSISWQFGGNHDTVFVQSLMKSRK